MKKGILVCLLLCSKYSSAQFYDKTWVIGAQQMVTLTFNSSTPVVSPLHGATPVIAIDVACSDVSDTNGNLLFYSNGSEVCNSTTSIMQGGDTLIDSLLYLDYQGGFVEPQTNIILPSSDNTFYLFYFSESDSLYGSNTIDEPDRLYYALIDMNQNGGLGKVVSKKNIAYKGLFGQCRITACRHANGRDWWLVHQGYENDEYYIYLVTPDSVNPPNIQLIGPSDFWADNPGGQSAFSPDGSKFVTSTVDGPLLIMNFDRCSGVFSQPDSINIPASSFYYNGSYEVGATGASGCCFSANGRFVYMTTGIGIWQYDTWASNIANSATLVGQWDTTGPIGGFYAFYQMYLLPNSKIIIDNFEGGSGAFHMIDSPDIQGIGCHFTLNELRTTTYNATALPNMINYRLGALSGSACDTLTGISNIAQAENENFAFMPVPASEYLTLMYHATADFTVQIYTVTGQKMAELNMKGGNTGQNIDIDNYTTGIYYYEIMRGKGVLQRGNLSILKYK